ncbi:MAG: homoserine dehydrogenase [Candidatus Korobacteraceae bacterium]
MATETHSSSGAGSAVKASSNPRSCWNVALVGFGTVGSSVARVLAGRGLPALQLTHICNRNVARKRASWMPPGVQWTESFDEILRSPDVHVIAELMGGLDPAEQLVRRALESGKSVVTANKKLIALHGPELLALARKKGVRLLFGAAVAGGIPVLHALEEGLVGDQLLKVRGIVNGTCNFVLHSMEARGLSFAEALKEAQQKGFAEADPTDDVEGYDARSKLAILSWIGLRAEVNPEELPCRPITPVDSVDFSYARDLGCTIRQISWAEVKQGVLTGGVQPMLVPLESPLAHVIGSKNMVIATGQFGGDTVFAGYGAGGYPTAVAVVSDLLNLAKSHPDEIAPSTRYTVSADFTSRHYLRLVVQDRPGIVAAIATVMSRRSINLDAVMQRPGFDKANLAFVVTVEPCSSKLLEAAIGEIEQMDFLVDRPLWMPILDNHADSPAMQ